MKVLHVITGLDNGGAETTLYRLTTGDKLNSHQVVALMDGGVYGTRLERGGVRVHTLDMPRGRVTARGVVKLHRLVRSIRPDVVQTWMYHADLLGGTVAWLAGARKIVWGIRGPFDKRRTSRATTLTIRACAALSRWLPKAIICNSAYAAEAHIRAGYARDRFVNIPNGYPLEQFQPSLAAKEELRAELNVAPDVALIGMVARFDPHKDHETLFLALAHTVSARGRFTCLLVGPGLTADNSELLALVERCGVQQFVKLLGPRNDIAKIMAALDLHVLSSAAESFPNVLAEAMASGTPCVSTAVGDAAAIVGSTGWLVAPADPRVLADALLAALDEYQQPVAWSARQEACRRRVLENYDLRRMIAAYTTVWSDVVNEQPAKT